MFYQIAGEPFREVCHTAEGIWIISYENPTRPSFVSMEEVRSLERIEPPVDFLERSSTPPTQAEQTRLRMIEELLGDDVYVIDGQLLTEKVQELASKHSTTPARILRLFYRTLAGRSLISKRQITKKEPTETELTMRWAIQKFYYSAKRMSLRTAYEMMLLARYTDKNGVLINESPSWNTFHYYFYHNDYHKKTRSVIRRDGLTNYQRNERPLFGSVQNWKPKIGSYQLDATVADIYLVSSLDHELLLGRPKIFLAVDTASKLITGLYVGMDGGEQASLACLQNAAADKVEYCKSLGIEIQPSDWPCQGLPGEIITDKGSEYNGSRTLAFVERFDMEQVSLPPFRPDEKSLVEQTFDLLNEKYKPLLRGKGVVEPDANERWMTTYKKDAILTLEDFRKILVHCILYLNNCRLLDSPLALPDTPSIASHIWTWFENQGESRMIPVCPETLKPYCLKQEELPLSRKGLKHAGLWYMSDQIKRILNHHSYGDKMTVAYDDDDISTLYVKDGSDWILFELSSDPTRYHGVTAEEYRLSQEKVRTTKRAFEQQSTEGGVRLLSAMQQIIDSTSERSLNHEV